MHELRTASQVIDALGGTAAAAHITGRTAQQVSNWRASGRFPSDTFLVLSTALLRIGRTAPPKLWRMQLPEAV